ncbi:MAG: ABC transporter permease [Thermoplasmatota archaeon]
MIGSTFFMEFRKSWKGFSLFMIIILLTAGGFPQLFPAIQESQELEGSENVKLSIEEDIIHLSWKNLPNVSAYQVIEDNKSFMVTPNLVYQGIENETHITMNLNETQYFAVVAILNQTDERKLVGMATTAEGKSPFDEMMESSFYRSFTGGREMSMTDIKGFISLEFFSWWFLLAGLYIGYISVSSISRDFEEKRMDIIFSTPISRNRYLLEKFAALSVYSLLMVLLAGGAMIASINGLGLSSEVNTTYLMLALIGSWPILLIMAAAGILSSVYFVNSRSATGITLLFAFSQYVLQIISNMSSKYSEIRNYGILGYWDYNEILFDTLFSATDFIHMMILAGFIFTAAIYVFNKKDIPV